MGKDWEEGSYKISDANRPDIGMPRGEVLIGGPMVCMGYLVDKDKPDAEVVKKNADEFSTEHGYRWFHTGDIGQITIDGQLQIIDRKKDLVKLQMGEHVALKALGKSMGLGDDVPTPCANKQIIAEVSKQCLAVCKPKLVGFETPKKIGLVADTWTPDNDLLTAAMKLKRIPIVAKHKA